MRLIDGTSVLWQGGFCLPWPLPWPTAPNAAPVADDDAASVALGASVTLDPRVGDVDPDGDPLAITGTRVVAGGGTVAHTATGITVTADRGAAEGTPILVDYDVADGRGGRDTGRVTVEVVAPPEFEVWIDGPDYLVTVTPGRAIEIDYDGDGTADATLAAAQIDALDMAPVFVAAPALAWASGDGTGPDDVLAVDPGVIAFRDAAGARQVAWTLARPDGTVLADGADPDVASYAPRFADRGLSLTLAVTADDGGAGGPATAQAAIDVPEGGGPIPFVATGGTGHVLLPAGIGDEVVPDASIFFAGLVSTVPAPAPNTVFQIEAGRGNKLSFSQVYENLTVEYGVFTTAANIFQGRDGVPFFAWFGVNDNGDGTCSTTLRVGFLGEQVVHGNTRTGVAASGVDLAAAAAVLAEADAGKVFDGQVGRAVLWTDFHDPDAPATWDAVVTRDADGRITGLRAPSVAQAAFGAPRFDHAGPAAYWNALAGSTGGFTDA